MDAYNAVFRTIRDRCVAEQKLLELTNFNRIANEANVPLSKLPMYLAYLQKKGVITYCFTEKYVRLTPLGLKVTSLDGL